MVGPDTRLLEVCQRFAKELGKAGLPGELLKAGLALFQREIFDEQRHERGWDAPFPLPSQARFGQAGRIVGQRRKPQADMSVAGPGNGGAEL